MEIPLITTSSSLNFQCGCMSCFISFLIDSQPYIIYSLKSCQCVIMHDCISFVVLHVYKDLCKIAVDHIGNYTQVCIPLLNVELSYK